MGNLVNKVKMNQRTMENQGKMNNEEMEVIGDHGMMDNPKMEVMENQEMGEMENQGTMENQEREVMKNHDTMENQEMEVMENQGTTENQGKEECVEMSRASINTISSDVDNSDAVVDNRASRVLRRQMTFRGRTEFFFLTIPGVIRLLEVFLSGLHIGSFGYFSTFYDPLKPERTVTPFYLSSTHEVFYMMVNFHTFLSTLTIIVASIISVRSHTSLLGSLFMFLFDIVQFIMVTSSSVSLLLLYTSAESKKVFGRSAQTRQGLAITGMLLGCVHLIGAVYDLTIYVRRLESRIIAP